MERLPPPRELAGLGLRALEPGVSITPVTTPERNVMDPHAWVAAFARGSRANTDLGNAWQPWDDVDLPVTDLRTAHAFVPRPTVTA